MLTDGMRRIALLLVAVAPLLAMGQAKAESYPTQPIKIIVGFGPGTAADILARLVGKPMETRLGQPIIVENRPGNSSMIAVETVARATADGHTLFMATIANTLNPAETGSNFDLGARLAPLALLGMVPNVLVAHPSVPANSLTELIALAKAKPDSLTFGSSGAGTASHMAAELFNAKAGTNILIVPYQGGSNQAVTDLLSGRITLMFNVAATLAPQVEAGKLRAFAVAQLARATILPNVPTLDEGGYNAGIWIGLLAPAGTPPSIIETLSVAANAALKDDHDGEAHRYPGRHAKGICGVHSRRPPEMEGGLRRSPQVISRQAASRGSSFSALPRSISPSWASLNTPQSRKALT
jgi:tripartite-type tricarboxylate transporter receptor subunit TctC